MVDGALCVCVYVRDRGMFVVWDDRYGISSLCSISFFIISVKSTFAILMFQYTDEPLTTEGYLMLCEHSEQSPLFFWCSNKQSFDQFQYFPNTLKDTIQLQDVSNIEFPTLF